MPPVTLSGATLPLPPKGIISAMTLQAILAWLNGLLAGEINEQVLLSDIIKAEMTNFPCNPIPALIADAVNVFPDPVTRPIIVSLLEHFATKYPNATLTA